MKWINGNETTSKRLVKHNQNIFETPFTHLKNFKIE